MPNPSVFPAKLAPALLAAWLIAAAPARAQEQAAPGPVRDLAACLAIEADPDRLACYDTAARALVDAGEAGDLVIVDSAEVRRLERDSFGLSLDGLGALIARASPLGGGGGRGDNETLDEVTLTIDTVSEYEPGRLRFVFDNGQVWEQTVSQRVRLPGNPKGVEVEIQRASLGSYHMRIRGEGRALNVRRAQ